MPLIPFSERLKDPRPLLADGAMGTMLHAQGLPIDSCFDLLNITHPQHVAEVHRAFLQAGAELLETNTFSANRYKLTECGAPGDVAAVNDAAVKIAREVIGERRDVYIAGAVGPLGVRLKPYGRIAPEDARAAFVEQISALNSAGVDLIILETFTDRFEILEALAAAREVNPELPIICNMTYASDDRSLLGDLPARIARDLHAAGADVIGVNCSGGPAQISRILQIMHQAVPEARTAAMPNAGFPESVGGRMMYPATAEYFADAALSLKAIGASVIGGCCGTRPEHIAAMRAALDDPTRPLPVIHFTETLGEEAVEGVEPSTDLSRKLLNQQFVVSVEMSPPRSFSAQKVLAAAQLLQDAGADVVNVADSPAARMRMSPWAVCHLLQNRIGIETILHFPTRGRNLLRVQGDLLAAHALGLRNLFVVMGDPTSIGDYPKANDQYDVAPSSLIGLIKKGMNTGSDHAGNSIGQPTSFTVGCALNMCAQDIDHEIGLLDKKMAAGADFALGQAVFEPAQAERFLARYAELHDGQPLTLPVLMGVMPLYSLKHATFLHNEVPGINIPDNIMQRIEAAGDDAPSEGVRVARELLLAMRSLVHGAYIIPAFGRYELAAEIIDVLAVTA